MKKLISVLLAVSALALSTSAFAASVDNVLDRTKGAKSFSTTEAGSMPCFRNGDTVSFNLTGVTGSTVTLLSSKVNASSVDNSSIQYINQYEKGSGDTVLVTYKVRELTNGTYKLLIKDGDADVATYYYKVANPVANMAKLTESAAVDYVAKNEDDYTYMAVASVEGATFTESGVSNVGFKFTTTGGMSAESKTLSATDLDAATGAEVNGSKRVVYAVTVKNVTEGTTITPTAVMEDVE